MNNQEQSYGRRTSRDARRRYARFCPGCGWGFRAAAAGSRFCPRCGQPQWAEAHHRSRGRSTAAATRFAGEREVLIPEIVHDLPSPYSRFHAERSAVVKAGIALPPMGRLITDIREAPIRAAFKGAALSVAAIALGLGAQAVGAVLVGIGNFISLLGVVGIAGAFIARCPSLAVPCFGALAGGVVLTASGGILSIAGTVAIGCGSIGLLGSGAVLVYGLNKNRLRAKPPPSMLAASPPQTRGHDNFRCRRDVQLSGGRNG